MTTCSCCSLQHSDGYRREKDSSLQWETENSFSFFFFGCEGTIQLLDNVKNLQNVSHRSALGGENVNPLVPLQHNNNFRNCYGNPRRGRISAATWTWNTTWDSKSTTSAMENSKIASGSKKVGCLSTKAGKHKASFSSSRSARIMVAQGRGGPRPITGPL